MKLSQYTPTTQKIIEINKRIKEIQDAALGLIELSEDDNESLQFALDRPVDLLIQDAMEFLITMEQD